MIRLIIILNLIICHSLVFVFANRLGEKKEKTTKKKKKIHNPENKAKTLLIRCKNIHVTVYSAQVETHSFSSNFTN